MRIAIIDYGVGNLGSVVRGLQSLADGSSLVTNPSVLATFDKAILPGVGNFADCAKILRGTGWADAIDEHVKSRQKPLLGICVGMQLLATTSSEGAGDGKLVSGLDLIPGHVEHLKTLGCNDRTPHVGWNDIKVKRDPVGLFKGIEDGTDFYFVHSYAYVPEASSAVVAATSYGIDVVAAVCHGNVWGTQFHPEKSSRAGFRLLQNFIQRS